MEKLKCRQIWLILAGMKKIVVASDSFKGSLSSAEVAEAVSEGIREVFPDCSILCLEVADGGEGTTTALMKSLGGSFTETLVHDPLMRPLRAKYGISSDGNTAIMEMSAASGLTLLGEHERDPLAATTYGTGEMIADALAKGCRRFLVGLGGSATNDAGTGMLEALGARLLDSRGNILHGSGNALLMLHDIDMSGMPKELSSCEFIAACDVDNPFCGPRGAAFVYAPQKGADSETVRILDNGLENFARITRRLRGHDLKIIKGSGASGGTAGAMLAYLDARLAAGAEMILDATGFDDAIQDADLVITGEGRIDRQTAMGKVPGIVLRRASARHIPVIAIAGSVVPGSDPGFAGTIAATPPDCPVEIAMKKEIASGNVRKAISDFLLHESGRFSGQPL